MFNRAASALLLGFFVLSAMARPCYAEDAPAAAPKALGDKWALVIGVAQFADRNLNVKYAAKDAADFRRYLVDEAGFPADHVKTLLDSQATKEKIMLSLGSNWLPRVAGPDDLVVIYISTLGSPSKQDNFGVNYLGAYDTAPDALFATGIPLQYLLRSLKERTHAKRIVMIVDASYSGAATQETGSKKQNFPAADSGSHDVALICSCTGDQQSWESKQTPNSVFTKQLIKALRSSNATTIGEAFDHLTTAVTDEVKKDRNKDQSPVSIFTGNGRSIVIGGPAQSRPAPKTAD